MTGMLNGFEGVLKPISKFSCKDALQIGSGMGKHKKALINSSLKRTCNVFNVFLHSPQHIWAKHMLRLFNPLRRHKHLLIQGINFP